MAAPSNLTISRFVNLGATIKAKHSGRDLKLAKYARLYYNEHWESSLEEGDYQITFPIHTETVNTAHSILTGFPPSITVHPLGSSDRQKDIADSVERWHLAVDHESKLTTGRDEWAQAVFDQTLFSVGVIREVYAFPSWWILGKQQQEDMEDFPITQQALDPQQVFWDLGNPPRGRFRLCFYEMEMSVADIEATYDISLATRRDDKGKFMEKDYDEVRIVTDWWEWLGHKIYHTIFTNVRGPNESEPAGQFIKPPTEMPEYWCLPYHIFFFRDTGSRDYGKMGLSILYTLEETPHDMEILSSRMMRIAEMYADPKLVITRNPQIGGDEAIEVNNDPGSVLELFQGETAQYLTWQGSMPDFRYLWEKFDELTKEHSFSRGIMGQGSDTTGFRAALDRDTSLLKVSTALRNYEAARANLYVARAYALSRISPDRKLLVRGIDQEDGRYTESLDGTTLGKYRDIVVEIKPRFPGDLAREINTAVQAIAGKLWSLEDAMEYTGKQNKKKTLDEIKKNMLEFHPLVVDYEAQEYIKRKMQEDQEAAAPEVTAMGPPPGIPGLPGTEGSPGQPGGAATQSGETAGLGNAMAAASASGANLPPGTVQPQQMPDILRQQMQGAL